MREQERSNAHIEQKTAKFSRGNFGVHQTNADSVRKRALDEVYRRGTRASARSSGVDEIPAREGKTNNFISNCVCATYTENALVTKYNPFDYFQFRHRGQNRLALMTKMGKSFI